MKRNEDKTITDVNAFDCIVMLCGGIAAADISKKAMGKLPLKRRSFVKATGRLGLYTGSFVLGAEVAGQGLMFFEKIFASTKKAVVEVTDEISKAVNGTDETEQETVTEDPDENDICDEE